MAQCTKIGKKHRGLVPMAESKCKYCIWFEVVEVLLAFLRCRKNRPINYHGRILFQIYARWWTSAACLKLDLPRWAQRCRLKLTTLFQEKGWAPILKKGLWRTRVCMALTRTFSLCFTLLRKRPYQFDWRFSKGWKSACARRDGKNPTQSWVHSTRRSLAIGLKLYTSLLLA